MKIGIDIVDIAAFEESLRHGGESFLNAHFSAKELSSRSTIHLAGLFAAKEAIIKTGYQKNLHFLSVQIINDTSGKPHVYTLNGEEIPNMEISLSHTQTAAVGVALWI